MSGSTRAVAAPLLLGSLLFGISLGATAQAEELRIGFLAPTTGIFAQNGKKKMFGYDKDELWNTVIKTYENVGQFGQFKKDTFLATSVYGRDYPPCPHCN
jgi:hypothetical protein